MLSRCQAHIVALSGVLLGCTMDVHAVGLVHGRRKGGAAVCEVVCESAWPAAASCGPLMSFLYKYGVASAVFIMSSLLQVS